MLTESQKSVIQSLDFTALASDELIYDISIGKHHVSSLTLSELVDFAQICNATYRAGESIVDDEFYDGVVLAELNRRDPDHELLHVVEEESITLGEGIVIHPEKMLSTNKCYSMSAIEKDFLNPVLSAAEELGIQKSDIKLRLTAKLDGLAGRDDGVHLVTRGDGTKGSDISNNFERGLTVYDNGKVGERGLGVGEIVILKSYFDQYLSEEYPHPRNCVTGIVKAKTLNSNAIQTLKDKAAVFIPYCTLPAWEGTPDEFLDRYEDITAQIKTSVDSYIDGLVLQVENEDIRNVLGSTRRYHRWQVAIKSNTEFASVKVTGIEYRTGRTGAIVPVILIEPTYLSGATISRVTAHHFGMVRDLGIGEGAEITITRAGEVIPKLISVEKPVAPVIPEVCSSCSSPLEWERDFLYCKNTDECRSQLSHKLEHWFKTMNNIDSFGPATIDKLVLNGISNISSIFNLTHEDFYRFGFGPGEAKVLFRELQRCKKESVPDYQFLGAFGIRHLGRGASERLLETHALRTIFDLTEHDLKNVSGFGEGTSASIVKHLNKNREEIETLLNMGFSLIETKTLGKADADSPIYGLNIVFTGKMEIGSRDDMKKEAKALGAKVQSSVNSKTDYLVCGESVGASKIEKARDLGVKLLTEKEYIEFIN